MQQDSSLKKRTLRGLFWSVTDLFANNGIQIVIQIVLARLLLPEHFGVIGMIVVLIAISNSLIDCGFSQALIRDQNTSQKDYSTVFHFNFFISILIYFILFISAPSISIFFKTPQLLEVIRVISITLIISSLAIIQRVKLTKALNFKTLTKINIIAFFTAGSISISMAFLGFGVWSLVINMMVVQTMQTLLLWYINRWIPSLTFNIRSFNKFFKFGSKLLLSGIIDSIYTNLFFLIIGKFYTASQLGYYTNAVKVRDMASQSIVVTIERVTYPVLSSAQDERERLKAIFSKMIKISSFVNFPLMVGVAVIATPLFQLLFGEKWLPSVLYFQLLCIAGMLYPIHVLNLNILQVKGRSDLFLLLEILKKVMITILISLALYLNLGILGLIWTAIIDSFISLFINTYFSARLIDYSTKNQFKDLAPMFFISILMGALVFLAGYILPNLPFIKLICQIFIGIIVYIIFSKIFRVKQLSEVYQLIHPFILSSKKWTIDKISFKGNI
ncbi:lipopolysaccharide biosynthesis protein [Psychrobacillus sp. FSL H8-0510]|uniref:lipopolysaccharide biosynthesis protein n=1 Tax=Psychrobacillus sp. FSL H8-0510 TaxID=2921394 RepID=UPI0030F828DF